MNATTEFTSNQVAASAYRPTPCAENLPTALINKPRTVAMVMPTRRYIDRGIGPGLTFARLLKLDISRQRIAMARTRLEMRQINEGLRPNKPSSGGIKEATVAIRPVTKNTRISKSSNFDKTAPCTWRNTTAIVETLTNVIEIAAKARR